jgi:hypothetical protein
LRIDCPAATSTVALWLGLVGPWRVTVPLDARPARKAVDCQFWRAIGAIRKTRPVRRAKIPVIIGRSRARSSIRKSFDLRIDLNYDATTGQGGRHETRRYLSPSFH